MVFFESQCESAGVCVCSDASNINGRMVAGEASLSQFLLGEEYRREFSFIATTAEVQAKAGAKNSLEVSCAVNPILRSRTGWKRWESFFYTGFPHYESTAAWRISLSIIKTRVTGPAAGSASSNDHPEWMNSSLPARHLANGYPWLCIKPQLGRVHSSTVPAQNKEAALTIFMLA